MATGRVEAAKHAAHAAKILDLRHENPDMLIKEEHVVASLAQAHALVAIALVLVEETKVGGTFTQLGRR
jgi:hypothetical protein